MNRREILAGASFGARIAEEEADTLGEYFVETEEWRKVVSGQADIVYGPKGSGKSALFSLLRRNREQLHERHIFLAPCERIRGTPVFEDLVADPPASEEQFRGLWKLYFLSLIGTVLQMFRERVEFDTEHSRELFAALEEAGLLNREWSLRRSLRSALDYVRRIASISAGVKFNPATGQPDGVEAKLTLREPSSEERKRGYVSADSLLETADKVLDELGMKLWLALDRLDVAFKDSAELEGNALRALFRVYLDMAALDNISVKIFLRDDIWSRITSEGFREASHITRSITISWDERSLLNLVIRRVLHNKSICQFYQVEGTSVLANAEEQERLFYRIFPRQVDAGEKKSTTLDWMLNRTTDATGKTAPRELIHLLSVARDEQLKLLEMGEQAPAGEVLIDRGALKASLPEVSRVRYEQTLCAEHPNLKPWLDELEGEKTQQTPTTLAKIWRVSEASALVRAEKLTEVGFFEKRGTKDEPWFWVPFLYRDALDLVQGQAEQ